MSIKRDMASLDAAARTLRRADVFDRLARARERRGASGVEAMAVARADRMAARRALPTADELRVMDEDARGEERFQRGVRRALRMALRQRKVHYFGTVLPAQGNMPVPVCGAEPTRIATPDARQVECAKCKAWLRRNASTTTEPIHLEWRNAATGRWETFCGSPKRGGNTMSANEVTCAECLALPKPQGLR